MILIDGRRLILVTGALIFGMAVISCRHQV